jgi:hypothetical protein
MQRLGLLNGLLIGLALALGVWGPALLALIRLPVALLLPSMLLAALLLVALGGLAGWLAARWGTALGGALVWLAAGALMIWVLGHQPYEGQSILAGLSNERLRGLPIYPYTPAAQVRLLMAGFFILLLLFVLGLLQQYRLEGVATEVIAGRLTTGGWLRLLLPLPLVFAAGLAADNLAQRPYRVAPALVHEVIQTGRSYAGDLFQLSLESGVNYSAIAGLRDDGRMDGDYTLHVAEADLTAAQTVMITAYFANGTWLNCRVIVDPTMQQVTSCYDAGPPYRQGLAWLLAGNPPETCERCTVRVDPDLQAWLAAIGQGWQGEPVVTRTAQWGTHVLMRAQPPAGDQAVQCLFSGLSPIVLERCWSE